MKEETVIVSERYLKSLESLAACVAIGGNNFNDIVGDIKVCDPVYIVSKKVLINNGIYHIQFHLTR